MNRKGFPVAFALLFTALLALGAETSFFISHSAHTPLPHGVACTMEAKLCPDGSAVGRVGPLCEFALCPQTTPGRSCTKDSDCPSSTYSCEALQGTGTACPANATDCTPTITITEGICKLKAGFACTDTASCLPGLICHLGSCTNPVGRVCNGAGDTTCGAGWACIQSCGPPVSRVGEPPPPYYCELNEIAHKPRNCPICLASNTDIATPSGKVNVRDIRVGMKVWSQNASGERVLSTVIAVTRTPVPPMHRVIRLTLADGRRVFASPGHPTSAGMPISDLHPDDVYDGSVVANADSVPYWDSATYDLLPDSDTGTYWADGILLGSTLFGSR